jgi:cysteine desulfurase
MAEIYLDHNATTPVDPAVIAAMAPFQDAVFGNASCGHRLGREARAAIDDARRVLSEFFGCARDEVVFTSGGTEANNLAIKGAAFARQDRGKHILIGAAEHPSVVGPARYLERFGFEVELIPTNGDCQVTPEVLAKLLRPDTILVSVMAAQNVTGTINRTDDLAETLRGRGIVFHTDAAQAVGKIPTAFGFLGGDLLTIAGHKAYGPKGVGALIVRRGLDLEPVLHGAGHEGGRRAGTENTAGIVGLAAAIKRAQSCMASTGERMVALRDALHVRLAEALDGVVLNGSELDRLPNTLNLSFLGVSGAAVAARVPELLLATGPACSDRSDGPSPTFAAMGLGAERSGSSLRISLGRSTTWEEIEETAEQLVAAVIALRGSAEQAPSKRPICPRCELHPLRLELTGLAPAVVCERNPTCRYEAYLAKPVGAT